MVVFFSVHPLIQVPSQLVAAPRGDGVVLECMAEASPKAINYWTRDTGKEYTINSLFLFFMWENNSVWMTIIRICVLEGIEFGVIYLFDIINGLSKPRFLKHAKGWTQSDSSENDMEIIPKTGG